MKYEDPNAAWRASLNLPPSPSKLIRKKRKAKPMLSEGEMTEVFTLSNGLRMSGGGVKRPKLAEEKYP